MTFHISQAQKILHQSIQSTELSNQDLPTKVKRVVQYLKSRPPGTELPVNLQYPCKYFEKGNCDKKLSCGFLHGAQKATALKIALNLLKNPDYQLTLCPYDDKCWNGKCQKRHSKNPQFRITTETVLPKIAKETPKKTPPEKMGGKFDVLRSESPTQPIEWESDEEALEDEVRSKPLSFRGSNSAFGTPIKSDDEMLGLDGLSEGDFASRGTTPSTGRLSAYIGRSLTRHMEETVADDQLPQFELEEAVLHLEEVKERSLR